MLLINWNEINKKIKNQLEIWTSIPLENHKLINWGWFMFEIGVSHKQLKYWINKILFSEEECDEIITETICNYMKARRFYFAWISYMVMISSPKDAFKYLQDKKTFNPEECNEFFQSKIAQLEKQKNEQEEVNNEMIVFSFSDEQYDRKFKEIIQNEQQNKSI